MASHIYYLHPVVNKKMHNVVNKKLCSHQSEKSFVIQDDGLPGQARQCRGGAWGPKTVGLAMVMVAAGSAKPPRVVGLRPKSRGSAEPSPHPSPREERGEGADRARRAGVRERDSRAPAPRPSARTESFRG